MRALLIAPNIDGTDVGEAFVAFKWAQALCPLVDLTVLSFERPGRAPLTDQLPDARVVTWPEPAIARVHERLNAMAKPAFPVFAKRVRQFLKAEARAGRSFDIAHQIMPQAARYPSPLRHFDIPYIIGPLGGALDTPEAFRAEAGSAPLYTRMRTLDAWRFRNDPWLRASYAQAACVLGVAPYVADLISDIAIKRFEPVLELGVDGVEDVTRPAREPGEMRMLHVGRGVRTKGLRDAVRSLAHLRDMPGITLTSAGAGEEIDICKAEAEKLGVADRVTFLGKIPRAEVDALYASHDLFCFPSFREPAGNVVYEAMRFGLPVITAARGGPDWIIDDGCGIRLPVTDPDTYAKGVASAARRLALEPATRIAMGAAGREKLLREGLWPVKARALAALYRDLVNLPG